MRTWLRNPAAILAEQAAGGVVIDGDVIAELIAAGHSPSAPVDRTIDAGCHVVLPGLINTHHHFYQTLTRAHPAAINRGLFDWLGALYPIWQRLTPEAIALSSELAMAELLLSGVTCAADHHYVFPAGLEQAIDLQVDVAHKLGLRVVLTRGSMSLSRDDGGLPPRDVVQSHDAILADSERLLARHHDTAPGAMVQIALAPCLGRADIGRIAVGAQADLALFRPDRDLRFSGGHDPLATLVLCGASRADQVMVAGRWVVEDGELVTTDTAALRARHHALALQLFA